MKQHVSSLSLLSVCIQFFIYMIFMIMIYIMYIYDFYDSPKIIDYAGQSPKDQCIDENIRNIHN